jgi:hypothetical protein
MPLFSFFSFQKLTFQLRPNEQRLSRFFFDGEQKSRFFAELRFLILLFLTFLNVFEDDGGV